MKIIKILSTFIVFAIILSSTVVFAEGTNFELEMHPSLTEIKRGDKLILEIVCKNTGRNTMQGIEADFTFDTDVFELQKNDALSSDENNTDFKAYTETILKVRRQSFNYYCK